MNIIPAIDIKDKKCVRLFKGKMENETIYYENPLIAAKNFEEIGFKRLHIVDLNGAINGNLTNYEIVNKIKENTNFIIQYGGGIRDYGKAKKILDIGIDKIIIGTMALKDEKTLKKIIADFPDKVIVGLDVINGYVSIEGWKETSNSTIFNAIKRMLELGVKDYIITDISKDGTLKGPNIKLYEEILNKFNINLIASGGVSSNEDLKNLESINIKNSIVGKALYENKINLEELIL